MKLSVVLSFSALFCFVINSEQLNYFEVNIESCSNLADAVLKAIKRIFEKHKRSINLVLASRDFPYTTRDFGEELLLKLRERTEIPVRITTATNSISQKDLKRKVSVLIVDDFTGLLKIIEKLENSFSHQGFILIILTKGEIREIQDIFILLWKIQIYNVNVVYKNANVEIIVQTFKPFNVNNCNDTKPIIINKFKDGNFIKDENNFFPEKMKNLFGCSVRVSICDNLKPYIVVQKSEDGGYKVNGGRDFKLIKTLSQQLNFTIAYTYVGERGYLLENGTAGGSLKGLRNNESDVAICSWFLKYNFLKFLSASTAYDSDQITFLVPPGKPFTNFEKLVYPFDAFVWILILLSFAFGVISIFIIKRRSLTIQNFVFGTGVKSPYLNMFIGFIGATQNKLPKTNFARFLLMSLLMYSLVMRSLYQGSFYKLVQSHGHHREIDNVEEIIDEAFSIYVSPGLIDFIRDHKELKKRFVFIKASLIYQIK